MTVQNKQLNIAFVTNGLNSISKNSLGKKEYLVYELINGLTSMGQKITLYGHPLSDTPAKLVSPYKKYRINKCNNEYEITEYQYLIYQELYKDNINQKYDIVHFFDSIGNKYFTVNDCAGLTLPDIKPTPAIFTNFNTCPLNPEKDYPFWGERNELEFPTTIFISKKQKAQYLDKFKNLYKESYVINSGLSTSNREKSDPNIKINRILFMGDIIPETGCHLLISALNKMENKTRPTLQISGFTHDYIYFEKNIKPFIKKDQIEYIGPIFNLTEKKEILKNVSALVLPFQYEEPVITDALESFAMGTPVIGWNNGILPEIIENGKNGFIVSSINELLDSILKINSINREKVYSSFICNHTIDSKIDKHLDVYYKIINNGKSNEQR